MGRRKLFKNKTQLMILLEEEDKQALEKLTKKLGLSPSSYIRMLIRKTIKKELTKQLQKQ